MAAKSKSVLSAGELIRPALLQNPDIAATVTKIFPVVSAEAKLPYISYRRLSLEAVAVKGTPARAAEIEVLCFGRSYNQSVEMAEAVRSTLDGAELTSTDGSLTLRSCLMTDAEETWQDDAWVQRLIFTVRI
ncbi:MAG: DUF3168 domain-containing protein [Muribaculaceae bacterium]